MRGPATTDRNDMDSAFRCQGTSLRNTSGVHRHQRGFSLVEVLVALAITSLASLALFQSLSIWVRLSAKTSNAAERALGRAITSDQFRTVVTALVPAWPEQENQIFSGEPSFFRGLTAKPLGSIDPDLTRVTFTLEQREGQIALVYSAASSDVGANAEGWALKIYPGTSARFEYLGLDGAWYPVWPPAETPEAGPFADALLYETPQLPEAIRFTVDGLSQSNAIVGAIGRPSRLLPRDQDLLQGIGG